MVDLMNKPDQRKPIKQSGVSKVSYCILYICMSFRHAGDHVTLRLLFVCQFEVSHDVDVAECEVKL